MLYGFNPDLETCNFANNHKMVDIYFQKNAGSGGDIF